MTFLLATSSPGKAREIARMLAGRGFAFVSLAEAGIREPFPEDGATYEENAAGKARHYARLAGRPAIADDSGIEVEALGGRPGLYSARYGGHGPDDAGRNRRLLEELRGVPEEKRRARYIAVAAVARPDGGTRTFRGACDGRITLEARGSGGFGYDPIFLAGGTGATFAELDRGVKDRISHRGRAFALLLEFLEGEEGRRFLGTGQAPITLP
ncbi:MAG: RdgB/HAM1 family non-canonical purine NTP pyrophosphatase [Candidatus Polarisedimenticolia bacterium]